MLKFLLLLSLTITCAHADEATMRDSLQKNYPQIGEVDQVNKTPMPGLYEVVTPDHLFYTDEQTRYLIDGSLYDLHTMRNLTDERARKLFAIDFNSLPLNLAMKKVKGNGKRKMFIFSDPNCAFCKRLEAELQKVDNVTIYHLLYPIFPGSEEKARNVWCSKDRNKAWDDMMLHGIMPPAASCATPIAKALELGRKLKVNGTPTIIFADGSLVPGYLPAADLELALNGTPPH
jgi:thiol:disulfide interchange protein DsbC